MKYHCSFFWPHVIDQMGKSNLLEKKKRKKNRKAISEAETLKISKYTWLLPNTAGLSKSTYIQVDRIYRINKPHVILSFEVRD